ncbi:Hypothetical protein, putative, partial [Bodo saltans]
MSQPHPSSTTTHQPSSATKLTTKRDDDDTSVTSTIRQNNNIVMSEEEDVSNPISLMLFTWVSPMFTRGWQRFIEGKALTDKDLLRLPQSEASGPNYALFDSLYKEWKNKLTSVINSNTTNDDAHEPAALGRHNEEERSTSAANVAAANAELQNPSNLLILLIKANKKDLLLGVVFRLLQDTGNIASPFILRALITWMQRYALHGSEGGVA